MARELLALLLLVAAIVSTIALFAPGAGEIIQPWHDVLTYLLGWGIAFAPILLAGFAFMLWLKTMPAERWMAASGAAVVAASLLGMFHLVAGDGRAGVERGDGGGAIGYAVSAALNGAIGTAGAWAMLGLALLVGLLLYFNMTVGDLAAAWLRSRDERAELAEREARRSVERPGRPVKVVPGATAESRGLVDRLRSALGGGGEDEQPLILRRSRPAEGVPAVPVRPRDPGAGIVAGDEAAPTETLTVEELETGESAHLAEVEEHDVIDAALEPISRSWELPELRMLDDGPESSAGQLDLTAKGQRIRDTLAHFGIGV
ncbi:MAG: DNA translocase FtsK 4TM domain-containing protein, partial [Chloroflexota bacterium]